MSWGLISKSGPTCKGKGYMQAGASKLQEGAWHKARIDAKRS